MVSKKLLTFISFLIFSLISVNTSYSIEPDVFVQSTVNRASQTLSSNLSKLEKIEKLKNIARETVDIKGLGFILLEHIEKLLMRIKKNNIM